MGLHLNYELRLPGDATVDEVRRQLGELHRRAIELPFTRVSNVAAAADPGDDWMHSALGLFARIIVEVFDEEYPPFNGDASTAIGFLIDVGSRCEPATFAFLQRAAADGTNGEWFWHCSCKTQYASVVSDEHLVTCHTSLVALLDHAIACGIDVVVRDETHYWETRDTARLIAEVHKMNQIVAAFAGRFSDAVESGRPLRVEGSIFDHPRFERLEMGDE
jgi:hypothetical protein